MQRPRRGSGSGRVLILNPILRRVLCRILRRSCSRCKCHQSPKTSCKSHWRPRRWTQRRHCVSGKYARRSARCSGYLNPQKPRSPSSREGGQRMPEPKPLPSQSSLLKQYLQQYPHRHKWCSGCSRERRQRWRRPRHPKPSPHPPRGGVCRQICCRRRCVRLATPLPLTARCWLTKRRSKPMWRSRASARFAWRRSCRIVHPRLCLFFRLPRKLPWKLP